MRDSESRGLGDDAGDEFMKTGSALLNRFGCSWRHRGSRTGGQRDQDIEGAAARLASTGFRQEVRT